MCPPLVMTGYQVTMNNQTASFGAWLGWKFAQSPKPTMRKKKKQDLDEHPSNPVASYFYMLKNSKKIKS